MTTIKNVQLLATTQDDPTCDVRQATEEEIAMAQCQWSVYIGEPGGFCWMADFFEHIDAEFFANHLCELHNAELIVGGA